MAYYTTFIIGEELRQSVLRYILLPQYSPNMVTLLTVHDAVTELTYHLQQLSGGGEDGGIVRRLGGVERLLRELSPVYRADEEVGAESVFWRAVLGSEMEKRVEMLMGNKNCGDCRL